MDWQALFNVVLGVAAFAFGVLAKVVWDTLDSLRADMKSLADSVNHLEEKLPETYLRRDDFRDHASRVLNTLERIEAKLDRKVDR